MDTVADNNSSHLGTSPSELCRACLNEDHDLTGIFELDNYHSNTFAEMYLACTHLQVLREDHLPLNLCGPCKAMLIDAFKFLKQCTESERRFREYYTPSKSEVDSKVVIKIEPDLDILVEMTNDIKPDVSMFDEKPPIVDSIATTKKKKIIKKHKIKKSKLKNENRKVKHLPIKSEHDDLSSDDSADYEPLSSFHSEKSEDKKGKHICPVCNQVFDRTVRLLRHAKTHGEDIKQKIIDVKYNKKVISCDICQKVFAKKSGLSRHMSTHNAEEKPFECLICLQRFKRQDLLLRHMAIHDMGADIIAMEAKESKPTVVHCDKCNIDFNSQHSYSSHMRIHKADNSEIKKFPCEVCNKVFPVKGHLNRHMKIHSDFKPFKCTLCERSFSRQDQLIDHLNKHNGVKPNVCHYCNKAFSQLCNLKDHLRTHTGETPFLCPTCGKGFNNNSNLRQHLLRHTGLKPFQCHLCPKAFNSKGQLTCHVSSHSGIHPYVCDTCGNSFTKPTSLAKHKNIHLGLKPFVCDVCNMRFAYKDLLKRHARIHTGEKPYSCQYCERSFTQSNDLVKHIRRHVGENIYECKICMEKFRLLSELKQHYPSHYTGTENSVGDNNEISDKIKNEPVIPIVSPNKIN